MAASRARKVEPVITTTTVATKEGRRHRATYAADSRNPGKWQILVIGPDAKEFAGREIPIQMKNGSETTEKLDKALWAGKTKDTDENMCYYSFTARPRDEAGDEQLPF